MSLIIITPNLNDIIKDIYKNQAYIDFFHDFFSIAYYTPKAIKTLLSKIEPPIEFSITTEQGYSF